MARILHVYKYFRPQFTGEGIFVERLAPFFARLRPDVIHDIAVTATARPEAAPTLPGLGEIHYLAQTAGAATQSEIVKWLAGQGGRYAAVHYHTHVDRTFLASLLLKLRGCRTLLSATLDDSVPGLLRTYRPLFRPLVRRLFALIDIFIAISPRLFEEKAVLFRRENPGLFLLASKSRSPTRRRAGAVAKLYPFRRRKSCWFRLGGFARAKIRCFSSARSRSCAHNIRKFCFC